MTINTFIRQHKIRMTAQLIGERPDKLMDDLAASSTHWRCVLRSQGRQMTVYFSMGPAHCKEPTAEDILDCIASDASSVQHDNFESWASDMGFDEDSRKAEKIYRACERQAEKLERFLPSSTSLETLMYECERL